MENVLLQRAREVIRPRNALLLKDALYLVGSGEGKQLPDGVLLIITRERNVKQMMHLTATGELVLRLVCFNEIEAPGRHCSRRPVLFEMELVKEPLLITFLSGVEGDVPVYKIYPP